MPQECRLGLVPTSFGEKSAKFCSKKREKKAGTEKATEYSYFQVELSPYTHTHTHTHVYLHTCLTKRASSVWVEVEQLHLTLLQLGANFCPGRGLGDERKCRQDCPRQRRRGKKGFLRWRKKQKQGCHRNCFWWPKVCYEKLERYYLAAFLSDFSLKSL